MRVPLHTALTLTVLALVLCLASCSGAEKKKVTRPTEAASEAKATQAEDRPEASADRPTEEAASEAKATQIEDKSAASAEKADEAKVDAKPEEPLRPGLPARRLQAEDIDTRRGCLGISADGRSALFVVEESDEGLTRRLLQSVAVPTLAPSKPLSLKLAACKHADDEDPWESEACKKARAGALDTVKKRADDAAGLHTCQAAEVLEDGRFALRLEGAEVWVTDDSDAAFDDAHVALIEHAYDEDLIETLEGVYYKEGDPYAFALIRTRVMGGDTVSETVKVLSPEHFALKTCVDTKGRKTAPRTLTNRVARHCVGIDEAGQAGLFLTVTRDYMPDSQSSVWSTEWAGPMRDDYEMKFDLPEPRDARKVAKKAKLAACVTNQVVYKAQDAVWVLNTGDRPRWLFDMERGLDLGQGLVAAFHRPKHPLDLFVLLETGEASSSYQSITYVASGDYSTGFCDKTK